jgi:hypothetical protein
MDLAEKLKTFQKNMEESPVINRDSKVLLIDGL